MQYDRRFEIISKENKDKFNSLVKEKNLSKEDLMLILSTIRLNEGIYLLPDVEYLIVETDDKNPVTIATIDNSNEPIKLSSGYRIRAKFN